MSNLVKRAMPTMAAFAHCPVRDELTGKAREKCEAYNKESEKLKIRFAELAQARTEVLSRKQQMKGEGGGDIADLSSDAMELNEQLREFYQAVLRHAKEWDVVRHAALKQYKAAGGKADKAILEREEKLKAAVRKCGIVLITDIGQLAKIDTEWQNLRKTRNSIYRAVNTCQSKHCNAQVRSFIDQCKDILLADM